MSDIKSEFEIWLSKGNVKKYSPEFCTHLLEIVSNFAIQKNLSKVNFFEIDNIKFFNNIKKKIINNKEHIFAEKDVHTKFDQVGVLYAKFLAWRESIRASEAEIKEKDETAMADKMNNSVMTTTDSVTEVLKQQPLFGRDKVKESNRKYFYKFNSQNSKKMVFKSVVPFCNEVSVVNSTSNKRVEIDLYKDGTLIDYNTTSKFEKGSIKEIENDTSYENTELTIQDKPLDWNDRNATNFENWIIEQGKGEGTAKKYRVAMNFVVEIFSKDWTIAKNQANAILGLKCFYNLIEYNQNFILLDKIKENEYSESLKAFYLFLNKFGEKKVLEKQVANTEERIWDWEDNNDFADTKPVKIRTKLSGEALVKSWRDVLRYICEYANKNYAGWEAAINQKNSSEGMISPCKLSNGKFIEIQYNTKQIMTKCKQILAFCNENLSDIKIVLQKKREKQAESVNSSEKDYVPKMHVYTEEEQKIISLFINYFKHGLRLQFIDIQKLKTKYEKEFGEELTISDDEIRQLIKSNSFETEPNKFYHIDHLLCGTTVEKIESFIEEQNNLGVQRIWIEQLYNHFRDRLGIAVSADLLVQILLKLGKKKYLKDEYYGFIYYRGIYLTGQKDEMLQTVANLLKRGGAPLKLNEIQCKLPAYPSLENKKGLNLINSPYIITLSDNSYAHINFVYFSGEEITQIKEIIDSELSEMEQTRRENIMEKLKECIPSIFENNEMCDELGIWKALTESLSDYYSFSQQGSVKRKGGVS